MRSNYKKLGKYIREVNIRNTDLSVTLLLGISIQKIFIPSIANIIGTDMMTYKIVKNRQFAYGTVTSRNGDKISIALLEDNDEAIVSQAYKVFEVIDENELLPEYLMMWFRRPEFDRYARYMSHGSTREVFDWQEMCDIELPVLDITKQQEIVDEYNIIKNRISLNNSLINELEETAQAIYREWFVDFEFPDENGKPYKTSGGEMEFCSELEKEVPRGWKYSILGKEISNIKNAVSNKDLSVDAKYVPIEMVPRKSLTFYEGLSVDLAQSSLIKFSKNDILIGAMRVYFHRVSLAMFNGITRSTCFVLRPNNINFLYYLLLTCNQRDSISYANSTSMGTTMPYAVWENGFELMPIIVPSEKISIKFENYVSQFIEKIYTTKKEIIFLNNMKDLILSKMASDS